MRVNSVRITPTSRIWTERAGAVAAVTALMLLGGFAAAVSLPAQAGATLKVMDWNIHHGVDTTNVNNLLRVATWIANINAHVVSLNEVEKQNGYNGNADEPAVLESLLESKTGVPWYGCFAQREGATSGQGNLVLSRIRIDACDRQLLSAARSVARATLALNGTGITVFSTHLDDASATTRATQIAELTKWTALAPEQRLLMGDFNASSTATELQALKAAWADTWAAAVTAGVAITYPGNTAGNTRNGRIDYIWRSKGATKLSLQSAQVYDTGTISDHRPLSATYLVGTSTTTVEAPRGLRIVNR
jgi:endonuclease/exonuclease/phosphatase family metal-dependent hydrolase